MKSRARAAAFAVLFFAVMCGGFATDGPPLTGMWNGLATVKGVAIPFRLKLAEHGGAVRASFFDGDRPTNPSAPGTLYQGRLHLSFPSYGATLDATVAGGRLDGTYLRNGKPIAISASRGAPVVASGPSAPRIAGQWIVVGVNSKDEKAWRLIVSQHHNHIQATILRVDGDTGTLDGSYADGVFRLSHFAGERPALLEVRPQGGDRLSLSLSDGEGHADLTAVREPAARAAGAAPADPNHFTGVADASAPFHFAFPNLSGRTIADTDRRFRGKVLVVDVMGSWCPNCHDEAPFLEALYRKDRARGLEVVALDFEQPDQLKDPQRLEAFVARYGITYTVLLAGAVKEVHQKLPQAQNLAAWPTTFFIGRDGRVKAVHVGFTSPGSGPLDVQTRAETQQRVETLLSQKAG